MPPFPYLTEEWRAEAERRLKAELTPERMIGFAESRGSADYMVRDSSTASV